MAGAPKMAVAAVCLLVTGRFFGRKFFALRARSLGPALLAICCGGLDSRLVVALSLPSLVGALEVGEGCSGLGRPAVPVCKACAADLSMDTQPSMEHKRKNVGKGSDAGRGASGVDKIRGCANESTAQEKPKRKYTMTRNHTWEVCGKALTTHARLERHLATHAGKKPYACQCCPATFARTWDLNRHSLTHTGEKRHGCPKCGKMFPTKSSVSSHLRVHTGKKPFKCNHCPAEFADRYSLRQHLITHSGEKPYKCEDCGRRFARGWLLSRHNRTHTREKPFSCDSCPAEFSQKNVLVRHKLTHATCATRRSR
ncbi:hypothetical protein MRX96_035437 [Rhipicephalus microplus]